MFSIFSLVTFSLGLAAHATKSTEHKIIAIAEKTAFGFLKERTFLILSFTEPSLNDNGAGIGKFWPDAKDNNAVLYIFLIPSFLTSTASSQLISISFDIRKKASQHNGLYQCIIKRINAINLIMLSSLLRWYSSWAITYFVYSSLIFDGI